MILILEKKLELEELVNGRNSYDVKNNTDLFKEISKISTSASISEIYLNTEKEITSITNEISQNSDPEMKEMLLQEKKLLEEKLLLSEDQFIDSLVDKEEDDRLNVILEIRGGTGGEEAALFVADLFRMYSRYCENRRWKMEIISTSGTDIGGYKDIVANIIGNNVFSRMKFESGVHRVQRIPKTEAGGRIHTSTATVAIMPEAEEIDLKIDQKDLKIDVYRASGNGGQSVNTTDSAVRITHIPTGIVVTQQDEKSQHKNKSKAMKVLMARIYDRERAMRDKERSHERKTQIGSGDRSERIRTYNFPQNRVTDHRINLTLYKIESILREGDLDEIIDMLENQDKKDKIEAIRDDE